MNRLCLLVILAVWAALPVSAQSGKLTIATVERPPFAFVEDGVLTGFSIDLMQMIGREIDAEIDFVVADDFPRMLNSVETGGVDGAIANISITGAREAVMDFSLPIFGSGLQIMVPVDLDQPSILWAFANRQVGLAILAAFGVLLVIGMLIWVFERRKQPYFDHGAKQAMFPAFWYALNMVASGGFGQNLPRSVLGRLFAVTLVLSGVLMVAMLVASITTAMTLRALEDQVDSISDLEGQLVATTVGSTASEFLTQLEVAHITFVDFQALLWAFEDGELDAIFFDGPLLAYYVRTQGRGNARLVDRIFRPEDYGIALPQGSDLREQVNLALLTIQETGAYDELYFEWFDPNG